MSSPSDPDAQPPEHTDADGSEPAAGAGERDPAGPRRPPFLQGFPDDPELQQLVEAFARGNYAFVRREAENVARRATNRAVREAARELRCRVDPDPLARLLLILALLLLAALVLWTYTQKP